jgi:hypothetical protein
MVTAGTQAMKSRYFYVRQLRDMKISADIDGMDDQIL